MSDASHASTNEVLRELLIEPKYVTKGTIIGSGCFGDVFKGEYQGETVAVKTMKEVSESNMRDFRAEILLTATLRHPNIINLIGACWTRELTCMVLEWAGRGTLTDLLEKDLKEPTLNWDEPMLKIAIDVARALAHMHARRWFDEAEHKMQECVIHRDLKPDNVLITDT